MVVDLDPLDVNTNPPEILGWRYDLGLGRVPNYSSVNWTLLVIGSVGFLIVTNSSEQWVSYDIGDGLTLTATPVVVLPGPNAGNLSGGGPLWQDTMDGIDARVYRLAL